MARLNVLLTGYEITDYLFERTSSAALALDHDTIRGTADLEIWTGAGGTGTQLALTTDYTVSDEDTDLSTEAGVSIYTKLAIVNGTYHNVDLYATYKTIGDYNSTTSVRLVQIGLKEITGNYTVTADDHTIIVNTASAVTITIPDGFTLGFDLCISRSLASTNAVTVAMLGDETIEGAVSFVTHGAKVTSEIDPARNVLQKVTSSSWRFVDGIITGVVSGKGRWAKNASGELVQRGTIGPYAVGDPNIEFPIDFGNTDIQMYGSVVPIGAHSFFEAVATDVGHFNLHVDNTSNNFQFIAVGRWRTA